MATISDLLLKLDEIFATFTLSNQAVITLV